MRAQYALHLSCEALSRLTQKTRHNALQNEDDDGDDDDETECKLKCARISNDISPITSPAPTLSLAPSRF